MISEHDFLNEKECQEYRDKVHSLKSEWVNRANRLLPFYTLGAASYQDASGGNEKVYLDKVKNLNPILQHHFADLYSKLEKRLSQILKMPVSYAEGFALPGFHVFLAHEFFKSPVAHKHFDLQFELLTWNYQEVDRKHPISFTCSIALPTSIAGLNYWQITREDLKNCSKEEFEELKASKEMLFMPYVLGKISLHQGLILHQIAPLVEFHPEDERITLQGHGLVCDGMMRLYW